MGLPKGLNRRLMQDLERVEATKKMQYVTTFERFGIEKGLEQGRQQGKVALLKRLLGRRFGELPEWVDRRLEAASSDELDVWSDHVLEAERLEDVFAETPDSSP